MGSAAASVDPFALPSLFALAEPGEAAPVDRFAEVFDCRCGDCAAVYALELEGLFQYGPPECGCGAGRLQCDAYEILEDESRERIGSKVIRERWVDCRTTHYCENCHGDLYHGDRAHYSVTAEKGELRSSYVGLCCFGGTGKHGENANGTKHYDETMGGGHFVTAEGFDR